jgi:hypothetical protein
MALRESVVLTAVGFALGVPLAWVTMRWIKSFLFGVPIADPLAIVELFFSSRLPRSQPLLYRHFGPRGWIQCGRSGTNEDAAPESENFHGAI